MTKTLTIALACVVLAVPAAAQTWTEYPSDPVYAPYGAGAVTSY